MLESLKQAGRHIERELGRAWESLSEGWHELLSRSSNALTRFERRHDKKHQDDEARDFPHWSLLSSEIEETDTEVVVRVEVPGLEKSDCDVVIEDNMMRISGEKRTEHVTRGSTYHMMERAYGVFQRTFTLPRSVDAEKAVASYDNGVLTVRVPKRAGGRGHAIKVT
jgi:HSP20 family protein